MNADGSGKVRLTNNPAIDNAAAWSPDASRLAFTSTGTASGSFQIYVMSAVGSDVMPLTNTPSNLEPSWSPDGRQIAFTSTRDFNREIYVMNADGSAQTRLTGNSALDGQPCWSPDGRQIAFMSNRDGNNEIYVMNADGTGQTRLTKDRKSTRLNSSHSQISYAVFCLKKKN